MKTIKILAVLTLVGFFFGLRNPQAVDRIAQSLGIRESKEDRRAAVVLSQLNIAQMTCPDFLEQVSGVPATLRKYMVDEEGGMLYFTIPRGQFKASMLGKLSKHPEAVTFAQERAGVLRIGDMSLADTSVIFFKFPKHNFVVHGNPIIQHKIAGKYLYELTLDELGDFLDDRVLFGGPSHFQTGPGFVTWNFGSRVAKRGEPSLGRLVKRTCAGLVKKEDIAQRLLDVVTAIPYDRDEASYETQFVKRPDETLLAPESTCAAKALTYASLLEQVGIGYVLGYYPGHVTVLIPGKFSRANGYGVQIESVSYALAETTTSGFQIGETVLANPPSLTDPVALQWPRTGRFIYGDGRPVVFDE